MPPMDLLAENMAMANTWYILSAFMVHSLVERRIYYIVRCIRRAF